MRILSITLLNQLRILSGLIIVSLLYLPFAYYVYKNYGQDNAVFVLLFYLIIFCIPVIYLHYTYYFASKGFSYKIERGQLVQMKKSVETYYKINDIKKIDLFMNGNRLRNEAFRRFPFQDYYYAIIELKEGEKIIITCLHSYKLDKILTENFSETELNKHSFFYPIINLEQKND